MQGIPARALLDAVAALNGVLWRQDERGILFAPVRDETARQTGQAVSLLAELAKQKWGEGDKRYGRVAAQVMVSLTLETRLAIKGGKVVTFADFTPAQKRDALEVAQRRVLGNLMGALLAPDSPSPGAALTGSGIEITRTRRGDEIRVVMPDNVGQPLLLVGQLAPGAQPPAPNR